MTLFMKELMEKLLLDNNEMEISGLKVTKMQSLMMLITLQLMLLFFFNNLLFMLFMFLFLSLMILFMLF